MSVWSKILTAMMLSKRSTRGNQLKLANLIGLSREKRKARVAIRASLRSGEIFRHTLLYGIGGTGKTAFARAIANELGYYFFETHGASYVKPHQLFEALQSQLAEASRP